MDVCRNALGRNCRARPLDLQRVRSLCIGRWHRNEDRTQTTSWCSRGRPQGGGQIRHRLYRGIVDVEGAEAVSSKESSRENCTRRWIRSTIRAMEIVIIFRPDQWGVTFLGEIESQNYKSDHPRTYVDRYRYALGKRSADRAHDRKTEVQRNASGCRARLYVRSWTIRVRALGVHTLMRSVPITTWTAWPPAAGDINEFNSIPRCS